MKEIIIRYIYERLSELSDLDLQRKLWLNENNETGLISSYSELMCSLFDDFTFGEFIDKWASQIGLSGSAVIELNKLRKLLNSYDEKLLSDEEIINDPKWGGIADQAQIVIEAWNKDLPSPTGAKVISVPEQLPK